MATVRISPLYSFALLSFLILSAFSQQQETKRLAVVIGNSDYQLMGQLKNANSDAKAFGETLNSLGFQVSMKLNLTRRKTVEHIDQALEDWQRRASEIVIYYAGHGVSIGGSPTHLSRLLRRRRSST